jgi:hypothetical protein
MFNLDNEISAWRKQMLFAGIQSPVPLDELESHLRDEITRLVENGADPQAAFEAATQKIGGPTMIKEEFSKIQPSRRKQFIPLLLPLFASVFALCVALSLLLRLGNFAEMTLGQSLSALAAIAFGLLLSWSGWFGYRAFSFLPAKRARFMVGSGCCLLMLWWTTFFFVVLPGCEFDMAQLLVAILWGFIASAGFAIGLSAGVERAAASSNTAG